jgi:hypothetical protein
VELKGRNEADDALGHKCGSLSKDLTGIYPRVGKLVETSRGADYLSIPHQSRQRLLANLFGKKILKAKHSLGFQKVERTAFLRIDHVSYPLHFCILA